MPIGYIRKKIKSRTFTVRKGMRVRLRWIARPRHLFKDVHKGDIGTILEGGRTWRNVGGELFTVKLDRTNETITCSKDEFEPLGEG